MNFIKNNCRFSIIIAAVFLLAFYLIGKDCMAGQNEPEVSMQTELGNNGYIRYGRYETVLVKIKSREKILSCNLSVRVCDNTTFEDFSYERELELREGKKEEEIFYIPVSRYISSFQVTLREREGRVIKEEQKTVNTDFFTGTIFAGVFAGQDNLSEKDGRKQNLKKIILSKEKFPEEKKGLDALDLIVMPRGMSQELNKKQKKALEQWEEDGGTLLVNTGESNFWKAALEQLSSARRSHIEREAESYFNMGYYQDSNTVPDNKKFDIRKISFILFLYLIFIGPVAYWLFKRKKQSGYWPTVYIPACAAFFTILIWNMGNYVKMSSPAYIYRSVLHLKEDGGGEENIWFRTLSSDNKRYHIEVNRNYDLTVLPDYYNYYSSAGEASDCRATIKQKGGSNQIEIKEHPAFSSTYFRAQSPVSLQGTVKSDLAYKDYSLSGSVRNELDYEIKQAVIVFNGAITEVGTIKKNETIYLDREKKSRVLKKDGLYELSAKLVSGSKKDEEGDMQERLRKSVIEEHLNQAVDGTLEECFLLGFIPDYKSKLFGNKKKDLRGETAVYIPLAISNEGSLKILIPDIKPYMISVEGDYDNIKGQSGGQMLTAEYYIQGDGKLCAIEYNAERNNDISGRAEFSGTIELYNFHKKKFITAFTGGNTGRIDNPSDYINRSGRIWVRYLKDSPDSFNIPALSLWKEVG